MVIVIGLYAGLVWLVFFRLKLLRVTWITGLVTAAVGVAIVLVFVALLASLAPTGRIEVMGKVDEVTPNVGGQVTEVPVRRNVLVKAGTTLFQIDRAPYEYKVRQLEAALAEAKQKVPQLKAQAEAAAAEVLALKAQWERAEQRRQDLGQLGQRQATSQFNVEDATAQANALAAQLTAAKAREVSARLAATSEVDGENTTVAQLGAQLDDAKWQLAQTTVRAPADGYVTASTLSVGDRASPARSVMGFIVAGDIEIIGIFSQNGFQAIRSGADVALVFANAPGRVYRSKIGDLLRGVGEGQFAASGSLARAGSIGLTQDFPVVIATPAELDPAALRLGMSGVATAFSEHAGAIGTLASILLWLKAYAFYL
jgi:multidrug resistance efflux pump